MIQPNPFSNNTMFQFEEQYKYPLTSQNVHYLLPGYFLMIIDNFGPENN